MPILYRCYFTKSSTTASLTRCKCILYWDLKNKIQKSYIKLLLMISSSLKFQGNGNNFFVITFASNFCVYLPHIDYSLLSSKVLIYCTFYWQMLLHCYSWIMRKRLKLSKFKYLRKLAAWMNSSAVFMHNVQLNPF